MVRLRLPRKKKQLIVWLAVLAVFVAALVGWSRGSGERHSAIRGGIDPTPTVSPSPSASHTAAKAHRSGKPGTDRLGGLSNLLPAQSKSINPALLPARSVVITLTSDAAIMRMGYIVTYGHPSRFRADDKASPVYVNTVARGYGLVAAVGAQASPLASYLTCTITVDGQLHASHTVHGGWSVAVCVG